MFDAFYSTEQNAIAPMPTQIFRDGRMLRGKDECIAGSGMYFTGSPQDTDAKGHHKGAILACHVRLGNQKDITSCVQTGGPFATRVPHSSTDLSAEGSDSVTFKLTTGREWVVHNWDQATDFCTAKVSPVGCNAQRQRRLGMGGANQSFCYCRMCSQ